ncbi:MAG TPA: hypothetical protein VH593_30740 [Ktedonobacteraceae bacterium]
MRKLKVFRVQRDLTESIDVYAETEEQAKAIAGDAPQDEWDVEVCHYTVVDFWEEEETA